MRFLRRLLLIALLVALLVGGLGLALLRGSLPRLSGDVAAPTLQANVTLQRDALGSVTLTGANRRDLAYALGWVHAQERYFQMDLLRRTAAGELAELVGAAALPLDRRHRVHRFRARAAVANAALPAPARDVLAAYRDGVNAGLDTLAVRPFEYLLLRTAPARWTDEDTTLVIYAMFLDLNRDGANERELDLARLYHVLPKDVADFLVAPGSRWEAPLVGGPLPRPPLPGADAFDLRTLDKKLFADVDKATFLDDADLGRMPGSNNFAVAGALTGNGAALVADDMHLTLRVPSLWFRVRLRYAAADGSPRDVVGVSLPGAPALVAGSNGRIAWGYTNSYGDWLDWVRVVAEAPGSERYRVPEGYASLEHHAEVLHVLRGADEAMDVAETRWGPIAGKDVDGTPLALAWTAHDPRVVNLNLMQLEDAADAESALALAPTIGMPAQNFVVGDRAGHIGWTLTGNAFPIRTNIDPLLPADWSQPGTGWTGWVEPRDVPRIYDPPQQRLWTANARTQEGAALALIGDSGYDLGARAQQIRDDLAARTRFEPADMLSVQLDDRAVFLSAWQQLLQQTLAANTDPDLAEFKRLSAQWGGRASVDSVAYRLVHDFRRKVLDMTLAPFAALVAKRYDGAKLPAAAGYEAAVWTLIEQRPAHLLDPRYADWQALLVAAARATRDELAAQPGGLPARTWGERNTAAIRHPLARALPGWLAHYLDAPTEPLPGDHNMPRVQDPDFGASERFAIAPGHEAESYLMLPGGPTGHPLSEFHGAGHDDWVAGRPTPLLPGPPRYTLTLHP